MCWSPLSAHVWCVRCDKRSRSGSVTSEFCPLRSNLYRSSVRGVNEASVVSRDETAFLVSRSLGLAVLQFRVRTDITDNRNRSKPSEYTRLCTVVRSRRRPRREHGVLICAGFWSATLNADDERGRDKETKRQNICTHVASREISKPPKQHHRRRCQLRVDCS